MQVTDKAGLLCALGGATEEVAKKAVYKGTACGAWLEFKDDSVVVGSIVEGVDYGTDSYPLKYPFGEDDFWSALTVVESEANEIWRRTHGCDGCDMENPETGERAINPNCESCGGEGAVI